MADAARAPDNGPLAMAPGPMTPGGAAAAGGEPDLTATSGHDRAECRIVFTPSGHSGTVAVGASVLDAARTLGVDLDSVCGGRGICGRCQVVPSLGSFLKWAITADAGALSAIAETEASYSGRRPVAPEARLGCQATIAADAVVDVPPESQLHGPVVRKSIDVGNITLDPLTTLHVVTVPSPTLDERRGLAQTVVDCLDDEWGLRVSRVSPRVLAGLHRAVAADGGLVTAAIRWRRSEEAQRCGVLAAVWPGVVTSSLGIAVDIGSTTVAGHLVDLHSGEALNSTGRMNPQIRLGEDLMSRVSYVMMHPGGDAELTALIRAALAELIAELCTEASADPATVLEIVLVGNPIMIHIALGIDPTPLGQAPFTLATDAAIELDGPDLALPCPAARVYVGPAIAGHVGADTSAAVLAGGPHRSDQVTLLVDVGTNAEIVLGSSEGLWAASSPTGPAFEGAQISCGQRAMPGAIERVRIDPQSWQPRFKVIGCDLWSDDAGFEAEVERSVAVGTRSAAAGVTGICGSGIIDVIAEMFLAGVMSADGVIAPSPQPDERSSHVVSDGRTFSYVLYRPPDHSNGPVITVTQNDVRAVQLAKAALRAGIDLLCEHAGIDGPQQVQLAGAFGAHIDPVRAMVLGLIGDCEPNAVRSVGNAAGTGAVRALLSGAERAEMEATVRQIRKIETATEPRFQELFVAAMALPHASAPNPLLATAVTLPERISGPADTPGTGSHRSARPRRRARRQ